MEKLLPYLQRHRPGAASALPTLAPITIDSRWLPRAEAPATPGLPKGVGSAIEGTDACFTLDEAAFTGRSIAVFANVVERVLAHHMLWCSFIRLDIFGRDVAALARGGLVHDIQSPASGLAWNS